MYDKFEKIEIIDEKKDYCTPTYRKLAPMFKGSISDIKEDIASVRRILNELAHQEITTLTFLDCLYFSTISMTTTGFGDIVPGKSYIRAMVIVQNLLSMALIVVVLNILLSRPEKKEQTKEESE